MKLKIDIEKIKDWIIHAPLHFLIPSVVLVLVLVLAGVRLIWFSHRAPLAPLVGSQASPATAVSVPVAKPLDALSSASNATVAPVAASTTAAPANAVMIEPPSPGIPEPAGLVAARAIYTLESSPDVAYGNEPQWSEVGHKLIDARSASFETFHEKDLGALIPAAGIVRESWSFLVHAEVEGNYVAAMKAGGYYNTKISVLLDGHGVQSLTVKPENTVATAIGSMRLGVGWHQVTIQFTQRVQSTSGLMHGTAELFWRGPNDASPVAIIPSAVDPSNAPIAAPETSALPAAPASASSTAPTAAGGVK